MTNDTVKTKKSVETEEHSNIKFLLNTYNIQTGFFVSFIISS